MTETLKPAKGSNNVEITVSENQLTVTKSPRRRAALFLSFVFVPCLWVLCGEGYRSLAQGQNQHNGPSAWTHTAILFGIAGIILLQLARSFYGAETVRCNRLELELERSDFGRIWRRRVFWTAEVREVKFGVVSNSDDGAIMGLIFQSAGQKEKCLAGLKAPEADRILKELRRLGADVQMDVAMPMLIEMEQSRRKSVWRIFG